MTLMQLNALRKGLRTLRQQNEEITIKADSIPGGNLNGMPSAKGVSNSKENRLHAYLNDKEKLDIRFAKMLKEYSETLKYIESIKEHTTYLIFYYRFIQDCSWTNVAMKIGGDNTADTVRMQVNRYLQKN